MRLVHNLPQLQADNKALVYLFPHRTELTKLEPSALSRYIPNQDPTPLPHFILTRHIHTIVLLATAKVSDSSEQLAMPRLFHTYRSRDNHFP